MASDPWKILADQMWEQLVQVPSTPNQAVSSSSGSVPAFSYPPTTITPSHTQGRTPSGIVELVQRARQEQNPQLLFQIAENIMTEGSNG